MNLSQKATFVVDEHGKPQRVLINGADVCKGALLTHAGIELSANPVFDLRLTFAITGVETIVEQKP